MPSGRPAKDRELCGYLLAGFTRAICVLPVALSIFPIMLRLAEEGARRSSYSALLPWITATTAESAGICWAHRHRGLSGPVSAARAPFPTPGPSAARVPRCYLTRHSLVYLNSHRSSPHTPSPP